MSSDLHAQLADLAGDAPAPLHGGAGELWAAGKRRQRRRTAAGVLAASALVVVLVVGVGIVGGVVRGVADPQPVVTPPRALHLPDHIYPPAPWSDGTSDDGEIGPLAAIAGGKRLRATGWNGQVETQSLFGVSAVDGTQRFLDFGLDTSFRPPWDGPTTALSPDGRSVAFVLEKESANGPDATVAVGWAVYDTVSGKLRKFMDPATPEVATGLSDLSFTSDSRYLVTVYGPADQAADNHADSLVLWDVESGERIVAEPAGKYWVPNVGSAPEGLVWARKRDVHWFNPATGDHSSFRLPKAVVEATVGPDGEALAYIGGDWTPGPDGGINGHTWRLYVGPDRDHLRLTNLTDEEAGYVLGWRDPSHVVVSDWSGGVVTVDVTTGKAERARVIDGNGRAVLASDLLAHMVVPGVRPASAHDPRLWRQWGSYSALVLAFVIVVWRRRARA
ncbi:hypothetical protein [Nocardioides cavernaquae]|uniref:WD40 repeat domain-containing protein n=1 Tax=Nocardioides cavernaquae TaxID=2321396 RepID=A0A3A5HHC0_9ACTN|nr:hypothetical protein [Nocardioides cavernaquae]RJS47077.1 hypothetical protein D4739_13195 [Nocardioides cavernaquae]